MILSGRIARLCQPFAAWFFCGMLMVRPVAAQEIVSKNYAILEADRFPFSLPESCAPRLGVAVNLQTGALVFRTSSLPPDDLATVEAVERCLRDLRPIAQNPRVTYLGSLVAAREKWGQSDLGLAAESLGASSAISGQPVFAVTRSGTRLAVEGYEIAGDRIRLRLIGGGTLEWAKEEIARIERADGTQIEPPPPPVLPSGKAAPGTHPALAPALASPPIGPSDARDPPSAVDIRPRGRKKAPPLRSGVPAPISSGRAEGCCVVQLGSFRVRANAERLAQELTPKQPNVRIVSGLNAQSEWVYRVRIPVAGNRAEAEKLARQLRAEGYDVIILVRR